jgi:hypothetical protein
MGVISYDKGYLHHKLVTGGQYAAAHDGPLPEDRFWDYLRDRRDLNEARFDRWHPVVGRLLRIEEQMLSASPRHFRSRRRSACRWACRAVQRR